MSQMRHSITKQVQSYSQLNVTRVTRQLSFWSPSYLKTMEQVSNDNININIHIYQLSTITQFQLHTTTKIGIITYLVHDYDTDTIFAAKQQTAYKVQFKKRYVSVLISLDGTCCLSRYAQE